MSDELRNVWTIKSRWPTKRQSYWSPLPYPTDGGRVAVYPPETADAAETASCMQCGRQFTADEYQAYLRAYNASRQTIGDTAADAPLRTRQGAAAREL